MLRGAGRSRIQGPEFGVAVSGVLVYRLVSTYLPPIWGFFRLRWLTNYHYL